MDFKVVWTEPALADLQDICTYIANTDSDAAQRVGEDSLNHVEVLAEFQLIGPKYSRSSSDRIHEIVCRNDRIFYRVTEERKLVEILTIWHGDKRHSHNAGLKKSFLPSS